jgi:hypothetical protein
MRRWRCGGARRRGGCLPGSRISGRARREFPWDPGKLPGPKGGLGFQLDVSISYCAGTCRGITFATDGIYYNYGGFGTRGYSVSIGGNTVEGDRQANPAIQGCLAVVVGGCGTIGATDTGGPYVGGAVTFGTGAYFGPSYSDKSTGK